VPVDGCSALGAARTGRYDRLMLRESCDADVEEATEEEAEDEGQGLV